MYISLWIQQIIGIRNLSGHKSKNIKWKDIQPSMVTHIRNLCSAFTHPSEHTALNTHTHTRSSEQPFMLRWRGSSWGFGALLKGLTSVMVLNLETALYIHSPRWQSLPDRDSNSQPFDYESDSQSLSHNFPNETLLRLFIDIYGKNLKHPWKLSIAQKVLYRRNILFV